MRSRSSRGNTSSRYNPVNEACVTVARSEPEPLTHSPPAGRPRKSISTDFAEVLPPPQLQTVRSAPSLRDRTTSCSSVVDVALSVIAWNPLCSGIPAAQNAASPFACHAPGVATGAEGHDGVGVASLARAKFGEERAHIRLKGCL